MMRVLSSDWFVFVLHLVICGAMMAVSYMLVAPVFGGQAAPSESFMAAGFIFLALAVFALNGVNFWKKDFRLLGALIFTTLTWFVLWCLLVSAYDMIYALVAYSLFAAFTVRRVMVLQN